MLSLCHKAKLLLNVTPGQELRVWKHFEVEGSEAGQEGLQSLGSFCIVTCRQLTLAASCHGMAVLAFHRPGRQNAAANILNARV